MPGVIVRRVARGALGMWTEIHHPNGDRVMVSMARREIKLLQLTGRNARKELRTISVASMLALNERPNGLARDLTARGIEPARAAEMIYGGATGTAEMLDLVSSLVAMCESADQIGTLDLAAALVKLPWSAP